ncbi:MAG: SDR family oxidoreductase, partial [Gammaproteobacteria bacterium]
MKAEHQTAVVTGAASGIGLAIARELTSRGYRVILADWDLEGAEKAAAELGDQAHALHFDAADVASIDTLADQAWELTQGVDFVFANAGVSANAPLL